MDDLIIEFLTETNESLDELDLDLVNLEQHPNDADLLGKIFRLVHTIKGTCGFLGLPRLEKVAHHGENVLGRFRDGDLEVTPEYVTLIFECMDRIKYIVAELEANGSEPQGDDSEIIAKLDAAYEGKSTSDIGTSEESAPADTAPADTAADAEKDKPVEQAVLAGTMSQEELDALEAAFANAPGPGEEAAAAPAEAPKAEAPKPTPTAAPAAPTEDAKSGGDKSVSQQSLRVSVDVLENLMTMVSELVLTRNQLMQIQRHSGSDGDSELATPLQRLNHVVSDLQEGVMKTRMQPIGNAWAKLPRIIRDLALELNKKIDLQMIGQETELDRQVLDLIKDPLTHMVRNSGDHGIEDPETRKAAGKPEMGTITLQAYHEGGHIIIKIADDGKGLAVDKIKAKVLQNGLASPEELEEMSINQINQFIFKAGFSTAEKVTSVSGRGVGMDVVRTNIEKIGGSIELTSKEGFGSTFTIKIPLTLAIVSALIVEAGGERFAIPQLAVRELVMTSNDNQVETIKGTPVFRLRDHLLPLVSLSDLLGLSNEDSLIEKLKSAPTSQDLDDAEHAEESNVISIEKNKKRHEYIVVTQVGAYDFGIIVDRVFDTEEIVVKPVAQILKDIELFSGNTILGDGTVIMILDPNGIAKRTGEIDSAETAATAAAALAHASSQDKTSLLLFAAGDTTPKAVPLSLVARLENVDVSKIERSGHKMVVQYRGQLMQLVPFSPSVQVGTEGEKPVLVFAYRDHSMGIIVDEIIDITEAHIDVQLEGENRGLLGSAIINDKATDIVDVGFYLQSTDQSWFKDHDDTPYASAQQSGASTDHKSAHTKGKQRILLVDDSPFFRNMLTPLLNVAGYDVTTLENPTEALKMCDQGAEFDVIISDIEMPGMDGFEFAQKVRENSNWQSTPMVALSSHATPQDIDRGMEVGFSKYVAKFDRDTLLATLSQTLSEQRQLMKEGA
ncbi:MAG: hybrid sensor histidine kinase/response regulator [Micavibrio sp.]|nr:hybrid sensor histidine kinase/response regulator [Micavibrio sp.]